MKNNYSEKINNDLNNLYDEIDYKYDEMFDKDVNKELVGIYRELSNEMTFNYDDGPDTVKKRIKKANALFNEDDTFVEEVQVDNNYQPEEYNELPVEDDYYPVKTKKGVTNTNVEKKMKEKPRKNIQKSAPPRTPLSNTKKVALAIILTIAIGIFIISTLKLVSIKKGYDESKDAYQEIDKDFFKGDTDSLDDWDFSKLFAQNPNVIGYIHCPDLLSYPIVQGNDNSYYLKHLFTGEYNDSGSIFADCNQYDKFETKNFIIYGHNMRDGSMFSPLVKYSEEGDGEQFYEDHPEFHIFTTDDHHYVYKVLAAFTAPITSNIYSPSLDDSEFSSLISEIEQNAMYPTDHLEVTADSKLITLSTCLDNLDSSKRKVVILIRDREIPKKGSEETKTDQTSTIDE